MTTRPNAMSLPEITFLTQDEVRRLLAVIPGKRDRALFQLAYHHGLRASEVSLLQRDDIHEKQGRLYIPRVKGSIAKTYPLQPVKIPAASCGAFRDHQTNSVAHFEGFSGTGYTDE